MKGFDNKFTNLTDYILKITYQIWENKDVESIMQYYAENVPVRSPSGVIYGPEAVVKATKATQQEFPDRQLLGEDVIWIGNEENGFLSSHRILSKAIHQSDGIYGPATSKKIVYRVIADCACRNNQVYDEWLVRDQGSIVRQIGIEPKIFAANQIQSEGGFDRCSIPFNASIKIESKYVAPPQPSFNTGEDYGSILNNIMNNSTNIFQESYDRSVRQEQAGGTTGYGRDEVENFWMNLRSSFPDAIFTLEHRSYLREDKQPNKAAIRWSLVGKHSGNGLFGSPTHADVYVMGICHAEFNSQGIKNEWVLFDETAVWKQILLKTG
jgi:hypothetical protein